MWAEPAVPGRDPPREGPGGRSDGGFLRQQPGTCERDDDVSRDRLRQELCFTDGWEFPVGSTFT